MDPITIIALFGNVLQFVEFSSSLISKSTELFNSSNGALTEHTDIEAAANRLSLLNSKLIDGATKTGDEKLRDICESCESTASELLAALDRVKVKSKHRKWDSIRKALRTVWSKEDIAKLDQRLARVREELNMHVTADLRDQFLQFKLEQSNGLRDLDGATKNIMDAIVEQQDVFFAAHDTQTTLMTGLLQEIRDRIPTEIHSAATEGPGILPSPSSTVPFRRDPEFICRSALLDQIYAKCSTSASRVALVGLGGVGKSQLAIEYSYQMRERAPQTWIFWVHASTAARFEEGYRAIAEKAKLHGRDDPKTNILRLVYQWLCNEESGKWVLVLDNADDDTLFFNMQRERQDLSLVRTSSIPDSTRVQELSTYLPQSPNGSILITTRNDEMAFKLTGGYQDIIKVEPMDQDHALALLQTKTGDRSHEETAIELVKALDFMPLAISQAAAYIRQRAPRSSVVKYLSEFRKSEHSKANLLNYDAGDLRRDSSASNSITMTWQISFDHIRALKPSAGELLSLMSFFDRQSIQDYLLQSTSETKEGHERDCGDEGDDVSTSSNDDANSGFEDDITILRNYSLISVNKEGDAFDMHRLVQLSTRKWLEAHGQLEKWKRQYITRISQAFPTAEFSNWRDCQKLFAHAEAAVGQRPSGESSLKEWALVLHNAGWYAMTQGRFTAAARMIRKALVTREMVLGKGHPDTLTSLSNLASLLRYQGKYAEAETTNHRALDEREKVLGKEHPDTLISADNLASTLRYQGKYKEAEVISRRVLCSREKVLGEEHPDTLVSVNNLALVLRHQGKYGEAEVMNRRALEGSEKILGKEHPDTLRSFGKLASVLRYQGKYEEAEAMNRQAVTRYKRVLGDEHPDTLTTIGKLALVLQDQGKRGEAEAISRQVLEGREKVLGKEHPSTLASVSNLALVLQGRGKYKEAEAISQQALYGRKKVLGEGHPDTLTSFNNLALVLQNQGKYQEAEAMHRRALNGREKKLGKEHPDTLASARNLASVLEAQGKHEEAENAQEES
ncbi:TPR-like protein [Glonium stellatum]|uniref:TPR-like protein n=1 Tax=Glonium stellatum TaxID=574774 RepID=A0A8E2JQA3_9PEZI|nr:TPR-like protein [Glonium stellatum]